MLSRSSWILFISYIFVVLSGIGFVVHPSSVILGNTSSFESITWGAFYILGGLIASVSTILRPIMLSRITPLWFFELSGVILISASNLIYLNFLFESAMQSGRLNSLALAALVLAYTLTLAARAIDIRSLITYVTQFIIATEEIQTLKDKDEDQSDSERG